MFERKIKIFKLLGFEVNIDPSWLIIAFLITWSLAAGVFPFYYPGLSTNVYWMMGVIGAFCLFGSIIVHEFAHSIVARNFGMPMRGITLFIFGGVAEMEDEPPSAKAEFFMAIVGPLTSIIIGFVFYGLHILGHSWQWPMALIGVINYLKWINWVLAGFNLLPAFPLDGGRVFRSILWSWKKNLSWATRIASEIGSGFGLFLSIMGIISIFTGSILSGVWWIFIGMFLRNASQLSYKRIIVRRAFEGEPVEKFMNKKPIAVSPETNLQDLVENYIYKQHFKMFPVVKDNELVGCVTTREVKSIPKSEWRSHSVGEILKPCTPDNSVPPQADSTQVLSTMNRTHNSRLIVANNHTLLGVVSLKDLLRFLSLKLDLEGNDSEHFHLERQDLKNI